MRPSLDPCRLVQAVQPRLSGPGVHLAAGGREGAARSRGQDAAPAGLPDIARRQVEGCLKVLSGEMYLAEIRLVR
jgi:hypothetical protein